MRVLVDGREYTLYIGAKGIWTMHTFNPSLPEGFRYVDTHVNVSTYNPFLSTVEYNAWE
jgi:hypothetical protein